MCKASFPYWMELSESVSVPQLLFRVEKSSSRRTRPAGSTAVVGAGTSLGGIVSVACTAGGVSVAGFRNDRLCQLEARTTTPATENRRHAPARQPMIQPVGLPGLDMARGT